MKTIKPLFNCTYTLDEIKNFSTQIYLFLKKENIKIVYLKGDFGSGKTTFVKKMIENLLPQYDVTSPTYNYVNEYTINNSYIWHFDLYRIEEKSDLLDLGIIDYLSRDDGIALIEWPEKLDTVEKNYQTLLLHFFHIENPHARSCIVSILNIE